MIIDLARFVENERPFWKELEAMLDRLAADPSAEPPLEQAERLHYLYRRSASALGRAQTFSSEPELRRYLEWLVGRGYAEIHETRGRKRFQFWQWFTVDFPRTFRRHARAFQFSCALTIAGALFGCLAIQLDPDAKHVLLPFSHLQGKPSERVKDEFESRGKRLEGRKTSFSAQLMTHNTQVTVFTMALGMTYGLGTIVILFYNGVILGSVVLDYVLDGQTIFLLGWLLPHGSVEIPAILLGGQAGFVLAHALVGWGSRLTRRERLRAILPDLVTIIGAAALLLIWAGIIEAFFSQYHEPVLPYGVKIAFGAIQLTALTAFLTLAGRAGAAKRLVGATA